MKQVKRLKIRIKMLKDVGIQTINDNQFERMKAYIESIDNTLFYICMKKNAV